MDTESTLDHLQRAWDSNPFDSDLARANSTYAGFDCGSPVRLLETATPQRFERVAHAAFREFVQGDAFSCLGAKAALNGGTYRMGTYDALDDPASTAGLARDLYAFANERRGFESLFTTYVAVFATMAHEDDDPDRAFEHALWNQLARLHAIDRTRHAWDPHVSNDPDDANFSYSFAGTAFFVVGMHPQSTRAARRFAWPTLVFNAHEQFEQLKERGQFARLRDRIRAREMERDGSLNPNLADYGSHSEARQYAGRPVPEDWTCPFRP